MLGMSGRLFAGSIGHTMCADLAIADVTDGYFLARVCLMQEKKGVEGSLLVFERSEPPTYGFFIMNRISLENIMELVTSNMRFKISEPYLLYKNPLGTNSLYARVPLSCGRCPVRSGLPRTAVIAYLSTVVLNPTFIALTRHRRDCGHLVS